MSAQPIKHSPAFVTFSYVSFGIAATMVAGGVFVMPIDFWMKGFLLMGMVMLIQSCIILTKTIRDNVEAEKLLNRIEDARAERLLMDVAKSGA
ncbi:MAG: YiaA/YiaB family inner membrane protein [Methylocystis sp.]|uniref:YiaA/YiaB family inner membrane protein n=1 Tax=Methylocystis sp. TaxID=1911079 RepID=UPI003DA2B257